MQVFYLNHKMVQHILQQNEDEFTKKAVFKQVILQLHLQTIVLYKNIRQAIEQQVVHKHLEHS